MASLPSRFLPRLGKIFLWGISGLVACFLLGTGWLIWKMPEITRSMYAHWAATDLIVTALQKSDRIPQSWQDLSPWYAYSTAGPRNGLSLEDVQQRVTIDFQKLTELKPNAPPSYHQPSEIIRQKNMFGWRWISAEEEILKVLTSSSTLIQGHTSLHSPSQ